MVLTEGIGTVALDQLSLDKIGHLSVQDKNGNAEPESCPFSWARSPENLLRQETYLALATTFVVLRLLYFFPALLMCVQCAWKRVIRNVRLGSLLEHPVVYVKRILLSFSPKEPCKRSNLQEGAMNAKAWASKSLATVSIGEGSTSHGMPQWVNCTDQFYSMKRRIWYALWAGFKTCPLIFVSGSFSHPLLVWQGLLAFWRSFMLMEAIHVVFVHMTEMFSHLAS